MSIECVQRERISVEVHDTAEVACRAAADTIESLIRERGLSGRSVVLGLATGSTPVGLYRELIRRHRDGLSFANVITFNLDEYYGIEPQHPESYRRFMQDQLFDHVDIPPGNTHVPNGTVGRESVFAECERFEQSIVGAGGIDIQILGIGRTGHIGFNEPGSSLDSRTRLVTLDSLTRRDAARDFLGEENVPRHAITMGIGTILEARKIVLLAWGEAKAGVIAEAVEGPQSETLPASFLQTHADCQFIIDTAASARLTRIRYPWLVGPVKWTPEMTRCAVLWLAQKTGKALLKLVDEDYSENGMADLLTERGSAYRLNIAIFNMTQHTITGWPGGKPNADDSHRPERAYPFPKRILILASEPMEDVHCMGGTLHRLANQGHSVTVAYMTSGNLAVPDADLVRSIELLKEFAGQRGAEEAYKHAESLHAQFTDRGAFGEDTAEIRRLKSLIRRGEARASSRLLEVDTAQLRFLDLPFYEGGRYRRFLTRDTDVSTVFELLEEIRPHQIFTTGYGHDPLSVSAVCFSLLRRAIELSVSADWLGDCRVWLYRGVGSEWEVQEMDMAVPLSPDEFENKLHGIYQHQTQRSQSPILSKGSTSNTWDIAQRMNGATAHLYDALGLAEYEAMEGFREWRMEDFQ
jgi:glucosamine-6-phosphate deaminase